jgi:hypothetical protein
MKSTVLRFPAKQIRSSVVAGYVRAAGYRGVVVFSCGNSAAALRNQGLEVLEVGPRGDLKTEKWWTQAKIHRTWPDLFDATSGHLSVPLMGDIAKAFRAHLGELPAALYTVPSGSGETICCLRVAYPLLDFEASYDDRKPETRRDPEAPLNPFVDSESRMFLLADATSGGLTVPRRNPKQNNSEAKALNQGTSSCLPRERTPTIA